MPALPLAVQCSHAFPRTPPSKRHALAHLLHTHNAAHLTLYPCLRVTAPTLDPIFKGNLELARVVFDAFLSEYPLCYGYWKKYADLELRNQLPQVAAAVYERGVAATPYSPDLWAHYAMFKKAQPGVTPDDVRSTYERGVAYNGSDFSAHTLWDKYIAYEQESGDAMHMAALLSRILGCPIRELDRFYHSFKTLVYRTPTGELIPADELASIRSELAAQAAVKAEADAAAAAAEAAAAAAAAAALAQASAAAEATAAAEAAAAAALLAAAAAEAAAAAPQPAQEQQDPAIATEAAAVEGADPAVDIKLESVPATESAEGTVKVEPTTEAMESSPAKAAAPAAEAEAPSLAAAADAMEVDASSAPSSAAAESSAPASDTPAPTTDSSAPVTETPLPPAPAAVAPDASQPTPETATPAAVSTEQAPATTTDVVSPSEALPTATAPPPTETSTETPTETPTDAAAAATAATPAAAAAAAATAATPALSAAAAAAAAAATPAAATAATPAAAAAATAATPATAAAGEAAAVVSVPEVPPIPEEAIKARWSAPRDALYGSAAAELRNRKGYEEGIKRPYFHVKPLDAMQLNNWIQYLDVTEARGDKGAIVMLYERCLVACASYPEFWMRYIRYLEAAGDIEGADSALQRALQVHCKRRPATHLFAARCEELRGGIEQARTRYAYVMTTLAPGLVSAVVAAANFERRQGKNDAAVAHLETLMAQCREQEGRLFPFMALTLAEFLRKHTGDVGRARKVIDDALELRPTNKGLWEGAIAFEEAVGGPASVTRTLALYDKATAPSQRRDASAADAHARVSAPEALASAELSERDREEMSARSVEFADSHADAATLAAVAARHAGRFMLPATVAAEGRKRSAAEAAVISNAQAAKVARMEAEAAAVAAAAAAAAAPMAAAGGYYPNAAAPYPPAPAGYAGYGYAGYAPAAYPASAYPTGYGHPHQQLQQQQYPGYGY
ncbi:MAG: hypothetical protein WDW36_007977 [Sanguina aurantia]